MNLCEKYRPKEFKEVIGNEEEIQALKNNIEKENNPHVFLLIGQAGVGKTTLARICANKLTSPLGIIELNTADNRGIDTARLIIEKTNYVPIFGGRTVYILDEVHRWTAAFQEAMLKPLEDIPDYVYYFLCTTDPQKLIKPLKSRCTVIDLKPISYRMLYKFVCSIAAKECLGFDETICKIIAKKANGSPREALKLLEKIIGLEDVESINLVLDSFKQEEKQVIDLCRALLQRSDWAVISNILKGLKGADPENIRRAIIGYMGAVLLENSNNHAAFILENFIDNFYDSGKGGVILACYQSIFCK